jgi:integrase
MRQGKVYRRCTRCGGDVDAARRRPEQPTKHERCDGTKWTWTATVDVAPRGAQRKQVTKAGFRTKEKAREWMADQQRGARDGTRVEPSKQTLGEYLTGWLEAVRGEYRASTWDTARLHVKTYIAPRIGDLPLQQLTTTGVKAFLADVHENGSARLRCGECGAGVARSGERGEHWPKGKRSEDKCAGRFEAVGKPLSRKTVHNIYRTLCRALNDAVAEQLILRNPAARAHKAPESPEQPAWTPEHLRAFYASVAEDRWFAMWRLFASTGLRRGEGAGLRWSDVDLDAGRLTLVEARVKGNGGVVAGRLKGKRGRSVSLDPATVAALRQWKAAQAAERLAWPGEWAAGDLVFTHEDGTPLHPDSVTKMFKKRVAAAGLPWVKLHGLRHTHATIALGSGENIAFVAKRLGHSSVAITGDIYAHVTPEMDQQAASRVAALIDSP